MSILNIFRRFKDGLYAASNSFMLLWKNKQLIVYLGLPITIYSIIEIMAYNVYFKDSGIRFLNLYQKTINNILEVLANFGWGHYLGIILIYLLIFTLANIALIYHTANILNYSQISIGKCIKLCYTKVKQAIIWAVIVLIPVILFYAFQNSIIEIETKYLKVTYGIIILTFFLTWSLITTFVIPVIALDNLNLWQSIKKSVHVITYVLIEYIGGIFWIGLISLISAIPFIILERYIKPTACISIILIFSYTAIILFSCIISTTHTILKTLLLKYYNTETGDQDIPMPPF